MLKKKLYILAILVSLIRFGNAQPYYFRHFQVENGLSNNSTICSIQDKKGFLWFGTKDGLNRFDGYSFKVFRNTPQDPGSIKSNFIHSLFEDPNEIIWVGTENGLFQYDARRESFILLKGTQNESVREVRMDSKGYLWFINGFTLCKYASSINRLERFDINTNFEATSICTSTDGNVWVSTPIGLLKKYNSNNNTFDSYNLFYHSKPAVSKWIERVFATDKNKLLIGTANQGFKVFEINTKQYKDVLTYNTNNTEIFVRNFIQTSENECWIASESGIYIYNLTSGSIINLQKKYNDPFSISDNAVYCFVKDKEGGIWAGTYFGGINYYPKQSPSFTKHFPKLNENSLNGNVIREIHQDINGDLWIGTEDAGLNKFDFSKKRYTHIEPTGNKNSISSTNIHGMLATGYELWIGTFENGLDVLNIATGKIKRHYSKGPGKQSLKSNFIYFLTQTPSGKIILGTTQGAYTFNRKKDNFSSLPGIPLNNWYTGVLEDEKGNIWASTYGNGIHFYNSTTGKSENFRYDVSNLNSISSDRVNSIYEDKKKGMWFATEGGLCLLNKDKKTFKRFNTKNGFPSDFIVSILEDTNNNLWISTSKGLVCFNPSTEKSIIYTRQNGLLSDQFNFNSAFKDKDGTMYFGTVKGMISFRPEKFIKDTFVPPVYFTGFQIFNTELSIAKNGSPLTKSITNTTEIELNYNESTFSIDFASLSYTAPEMSEYAYKMEGLDKDWIYLKTNRKVYFTELSPGTYNFKVRASNSSGEWSKQETTLLIKILPPWWLSKTAYFIYSILAFVIIYHFTKLYHKNLEQKNKRKIEILEAAKEKEIFHEKIDFFTNIAHEIKTPLTLIKGPLEKVIKNTEELPAVRDSLKIMERNTNRLIDLTNQFLDFRQTEIKGFSINFERTNISELLEENFLNFKSLAEQKNLCFSIELSIPKLFAWVDIEAFNKVVSNLLNNAIKYAERKVTVKLLPLAKKERFFSIMIINDGYLIPIEMSDKIFEPFYRLKETNKQKGTGIGLALALSLVQLHKGKLVFNQSADCKNVFLLTIPINQEKA